MRYCFEMAILCKESFYSCINSMKLTFLKETTTPNNFLLIFKDLLGVNLFSKSEICQCDMPILVQHQILWL